jgi:hypothetical protein
MQRPAQWLWRDTHKRHTGKALGAYTVYAATVFRHRSTDAT